MNCKSMLPGLLLLVLGHLSPAAQYAYHPDARLYLGGGFNPFSPDRGYLGCIESDGEEQVETQGAVGSDVGISLVTTREDLYQKINFSASLSGSYTFYNASGSVRYEDEQAFHSDSLTWLIFFRSNYGHFALKNARLKTELSGVTSDQLYERCGSEIVTERKKGVMIFALLTVRNLSQSRRHEFESKLSGSANGTFWSAQMDAQYKEVFRSALASSDISIRIHAVGGKGITDLTDILRPEAGSSFVAYEKLPLLMANYITTLTSTNAAPTQYVTTQLRSFRPNLPVRFENFKSGQVGALYNRYMNASSIVGRADEILTSSSDEYDLSPAARASLQDVRQVYERNMNALYSAAQKCFVVGAGCLLPSLEDAAFQWPKARPSESHCEELRAYVYSRGMIDSGIYKMARQRDFVPLMTPNTDQIEGWAPCADLGK